MEQEARLFEALLDHELIPALGCTEPIALAYAAALATEVLGARPEAIELRASNNIIKNVKSVTVPGSGGMAGMEAATVLGALGGTAKNRLEVLQSLTPDSIDETEKFIKDGKITVKQLLSEHPLHIIVTVKNGEHSASCELRDEHTNVVALQKDGQDLRAEDLPEDLRGLFNGDHGAAAKEALPNPFADFNVSSIIDFCEKADISLLMPFLERQINLNVAIAEEGLAGGWGLEVGKNILPAKDSLPEELYLQRKATAYAAAGSDARMTGSPMPVVINSGSGNQSLTVSMPVWVYATELDIPKDRFYRALLLSNLLALYQKSFIGRLSAYCGAVSAAAGAVAGISWMLHGDREEIERTLINTLVNISGMVCDGAKASCAFKISASLDTAFLAWKLAQNGDRFAAGDGLAKDTADKTIRAVGKMAREGMKETDATIVGIMLEP